MNVSDTNTFTVETFKTNHKLTGDDNWLIYLLSCKCCGKQYVGETTDSFRYRWNNIKDNDTKHSRKESCSLAVRLIALPPTHPTLESHFSKSVYVVSTQTPPSVSTISKVHQNHTTPPPSRSIPPKSIQQIPNTYITPTLSSSFLDIH